LPQRAFTAVVTQANAERDQLRLRARTEEADAAQRSAAGSQRDLQTSREMAGEFEARATALQAQLRELNAKQTERGMVITIGDVPFDTNRADLKGGGAAGRPSGTPRACPCCARRRP